MPRTTIRSEDVTDAQIKTADMAVDPTNASNLSSGSVPLAQLGNAPATDLTGLEADIALLAFKTQANGNLARYSLVDQSVDAFEDATGVNSGASTNATRNTTGKYYAGATPTQEALTTVGSSSWTAPAAIVTPMTLLVVGGGGGSASTGNGNGAGGAGGLVYISNYTVVGGQAYTYTVGDGGDGVASSPNNASTNGGNSVFDGAAFHQTITGNGGGKGGSSQAAAGAGGSGGGEANGPGYNTPAVSNQPADFGSYTGVGFGNSGGKQGANSLSMSSGGGGGAGGVGGNSPSSPNGYGGDGGIGKDYSAVFGTGVGDSGWFAGGGGGAGGPSPPAGPGGQGGGGAGGQYGSGLNAGGGTPGTANTGGGGGGAAADKYPSGAGGSGVIILKYDTLGDMVLVSNAVTAQAQPTKGDVVLTYTDNTGTATLNTDLIASVSRDGGTTYTAVTLVGKGTTGTQTIATASDVTISGQPAGTSMVYKIATYNQSGSKKTYINGVSLGWS